MERDLASFHQPDQKRPGDAENVGGALRSELLMLRDNRNRIPRLQVPQNHEKKFVDWLRDRDLPAIRSHQLGVSRLNQAPEIADLRFLVFWNRG
jgi:hypothetical protein